MLERNPNIPADSRRNIRPKIIKRQQKTTRVANDLPSGRFLFSEVCFLLASLVVRSIVGQANACLGARKEQRGAIIVYLVEITCFGVRHKVVDDVEELCILNESIGACIGNVNEELANVILLGNIGEIERQIDLGALAKTGEDIGILNGGNIVLLGNSTGDVTYGTIEIDAIELEGISIDTSHKGEQ